MSGSRESLPEAMLGNNKNFFLLEKLCNMTGTNMLGQLATSGCQRNRAIVSRELFASRLVNWHHFGNQPDSGKATLLQRCAEQNKEILRHDLAIALQEGVSNRSSGVG